MNQATLPQGVKVKTVAELTRDIKGVLEEGFPEVWVSGQISGYKPQGQSGHVYFRLKDEDAILPAVIWRSTVARLKFEPHDGLEVIASGRIEVYPPHGKYQLIIQALQPKGLGALELAFRQLCEKLKKEGLFEKDRKKPLPGYPMRIALITSKEGAAVADECASAGDRRDEAMSCRRATTRKAISRPRTAKERTSESGISMPIPSSAPDG